MNRANDLESVLDRLDIGLCWEWGGSLNRAGYGWVSISGKRWVVHRFIWESLVGPVSEGLELDHLCRNKKCSNPDHLEPVTHAENIRRGFNGSSTRCRNNHELTPENTYIVGRKKVRRRCRLCERDKKRRFAERKWVQP